jgi:hypothetical protein
LVTVSVLRRLKCRYDAPGGRQDPFEWWWNALVAVKTPSKRLIRAANDGAAKQLIQNILAKSCRASGG